MIQVRVSFWYLGYCHALGVYVHCSTRLELGSEHPSQSAQPARMALLLLQPTTELLVFNTTANSSILTNHPVPEPHPSIHQTLVHCAHWQSSSLPWRLASVLAVSSGLHHPLAPASQCGANRIKCLRARYDQLAHFPSNNSLFSSPHTNFPSHSL